MENKTFLIKYEIVLNDGSIIKDKEMKVKRCFNGVAAQFKLEGYLKRKYSNFKEMRVYECEEDIDIFSYLDHFTPDFDDYFKGGLSACGNKWILN